MLDSFLKVALSHSERASEQERLVAQMRKLPEDLLFKLATGEEKLAYGIACGPGGGDLSWLDRFKGTPLFEPALELEKQDLQEQMAERARWTEEDATRSARNAKRDELGIQRKLLELQLAESEAGGGAAQPFAGQETPEEEALEHGAGSPEVAAAAQQQPPPQAPAAPPKEEPSPEKAAMAFAYAKMKMASVMGPEGAPAEAVETEVVPGQKMHPAAKAALIGGAAGVLPGAVAAAGMPSSIVDQGLSLGDMAISRGNMLRGALRSGAEGAAILGGGALAGSTAEGAGSGALRGALGGALPGAALGALRSRSLGIPGAGVGGLLGAGTGALAGSVAGALSAKKKPQEVSPQVEEPGVQAGMPEQKVAALSAAMRKTALGLGGLGSAVAGGAKAVGKGALGAFQTSRAFGGGLGEAARAAGSSVMTKAPGALSTMGRAATSFAKANPMQAAGLAGATGLAGGYAAGHMGSRQ